MSDARIKEVLEKWGEDFSASVWRVQGSAVIYHKTLERIAAKAGIWFELPQIIRHERDEAVILVCGKMPEASPEWSIGEAVIGMNYRVSGKQSAYPYAMAEKRAKDRVILKLIELAGFVYSEEEADDFKRRDEPEAPPSATKAPQPLVPSGVATYPPGQPGGTPSPKVSSGQPEPPTHDELLATIMRMRTKEALTDLMKSPRMISDIEALEDWHQKNLRDVAKERFRKLPDATMEV